MNHLLGKPPPFGWRCRDCVFSSCAQVLVSTVLDTLLQVQRWRTFSKLITPSEIDAFLPKAIVFRERKGWAAAFFSILVTLPINLPVSRTSGTFVKLNRKLPGYFLLNHRALIIVSRWMSFVCSWKGREYSARFGDLIDLACKLNRDAFVNKQGC